MPVNGFVEGECYSKRVGRAAKAVNVFHHLHDFFSVFTEVLVSFVIPV